MCHFPFYFLIFCAFIRSFHGSCEPSVSSPHRYKCVNSPRHWLDVLKHFSRAQSFLFLFFFLFSSFKFSIHSCHVQKYCVFVCAKVFWWLFFRSLFLFLFIICNFCSSSFQVHNFSYCRCNKKEKRRLFYSTLFSSAFNSICALPFWLCFFCQHLSIIYCVSFFSYFFFHYRCEYIRMPFFVFRCAQNTKSKNRAQIIYIFYIRQSQMLLKSFRSSFGCSSFFPFTLFKWFNHLLPSNFFFFCFV